MNYSYFYPFIAFLIFTSIACKNPGSTKAIENEEKLIVHDRHVHIMSPDLIKDWKNLGISFSKPDSHYANLDTILKNNGADFINLIGMGYVYGSPEFYQGNEAYQKLKQENNYLFKVAQNQKKKVTPFFAIDPLKEYALEEIKRCLKLTNNAGLKLHFSSSQVYLTEPEHLKKVQSVFNIAATNELPILLHFDNWHPKFGTPDIEILADSILATLAPIHLTIAHFGTSGAFNQKTKNVIDTFVKLFENGRIQEKHTILFDISAVALDKDSEGVTKLTNDEFSELRTYCDKIGFDKIVFGTDYPLYSTNEYIDILKTRLGLSMAEIKQISKE